nr:unnamed protein product [Callosobruchus chinensis]
MDAQLNNSIRVLIGAIRSTEISWLSVLSNIAPSREKREGVAVQNTAVPLTCQLQVLSSDWCSLPSAPSQPTPQIAQKECRLEEVLLSPFYHRAPPKDIFSLVYVRSFRSVRVLRNIELEMIEVKGKSNCLSLSKKAHILEDSNKGLNVSVLAKKYGIAKSTVCLIKDKRDRILEMDFGAQEDSSSDDESNRFFKEVIEMGIKNKSESQLLRHFKSDDIATNLSIYQLMLTFSSTGQSSYDDFIEFCSSVMTEQKCSAAATETASQSDSSLWFDLRYGRMTASKLYDVAHCKKNDGVLVHYW